MTEEEKAAKELADQEAAAAAAAATPVVDNSDQVVKLQSDVSEKDSLIATLRGELSSAQVDAAKKEEYQTQLFEAITERTDLAKKLSDAQEAKSKLANAASKATDTLSVENAELKKKIAEYEAQVAVERSRNTKLEILQTEFAHLLPYADRIMNSEDKDTVRADARKFDKTRENDLNNLRNLGSTNILNGGLPVNPQRVEPADPGDLNKINEQLTEAMNISADEFEKVKKQLLESYEASLA